MLMGILYPLQLIVTIEHAVFYWTHYTFLNIFYSTARFLSQGSLYPIEHILSTERNVFY